MSFLTDALDELVATLGAVGETVADSAAAIRPPVAVVDPPTVSTVSGSIFTVDWLVTLTEQPPGSDRAVRRLLDRVAAIGAVLPISSASPTVYSVAGTDLPGMSLTIQLAYRTDPVVPIPNVPLSAYEDSPIEESGAKTITNGAIAHEFGDWVEMIASTSAAADYLYPYVFNAQNNTNTAALLEIGVGPAGSETPLLPAFPVGGWSTPDVRLPIHVPAGSRIACRIAGVNPARNSTCQITTAARSPLVAQSRSSATVYGADPATSAGIPILSASPIELGVLATAAAEITILPSLASAATIPGDPTYWQIYTGPAGAETELGVVSFARSSAEAIVINIGQVTRTTFPGVFPAGTRISAGLISGTYSAWAALIAFHN